MVVAAVALAHMRGCGRSHMLWLWQESHAVAVTSITCSVYGYGGSSCSGCYMLWLWRVSHAVVVASVNAAAWLVIFVSSD